MVKSVEDICVFESSWADTVEGAIHKYPNSFSKNVASVDIIERHIDENGTLVTKKLLRSRFMPNSILKKVMSTLGFPNRRFQSTLECSTLDLAKKNYELKSLNKTYFNKIRVFEVLQYTPDQEQPDSHTTLNQFAHIDMYASECNFAVRWAVKVGEEQFAKNYVKTSQQNRQGLKDVIHQLQIEWQDVALQIKREVESKTQAVIEEVECQTRKVVDKTITVADEVKHDVGKIAGSVNSAIVDALSPPTDQQDK